MKKWLAVSGILVLLLGVCSGAYAHFQYIIPSNTIVESGESTNLSLYVIFGHPFEGNYMNMEKPREFGVMTGGKKKDLLDSLNPMQVGQGKQAFSANYSVRQPGDHIFYIEPEPYFEPAEDKFIVHYTKVVVNAFGLQQGWDQNVGLKTEIVPLTRPYGLWTGNVFQGVVMAYGEPVPYAEIEVEYFADGSLQAPADPFITQVIKADENGVFTYACPMEGWWAFAALTEARQKMAHSDGKDYPVELGAVFWVKVHDMP
ncbi:MAG: DUF4198 domain-containing protein [Spirochaetota bacterium]